MKTIPLGVKIIRWRLRVTNRYRAKILYSDGDIEEWWLGGNNPDHVTHGILEDEKTFLKQCPNMKRRVVKILGVREDNPTDGD